MRMLNILILFFSSTCLCFAQEEKEVISPKWLTYEHPEFEVNYPPDWTINENSTYGATLEIYSPIENDEDEFRENMSLLIKEQEELKMALNEYVDANIEQIKTMFNATIESLADIDADGKTWRSIVFVFQQGEMNIRCQQFYHFEYDKIFIWTYTGIQGQNDIYENEIKGMFDSFAMKKHERIIKEKEEVKGKIKEEGDLITYERDSYSIQFSKDWIIDESNFMGMDFMIFAPSENGANTFRENLNIVLEDISAFDIDLAQYVELSTSQLTKFIEDFELLSSDTKSSANGDYQEVIYQGMQGKLKLKWLQRYLVTSEKAFVITFTAEPESFGDYLKEVEVIMNSFEMVKDK